MLSELYAVPRLEEELPSEPLGTPTDIPVPPEDGMPWWRPGWRDIIPHIGYRWVFLLPAVLVVALFLASWIFPGLRSLFFILGFKLLLIVIAIAVSLAGYFIRVATRVRTEPFCIHCGYNLTGLPDHYRCPECGRRYTWQAINEYRRDPQWFIERYYLQRKLPPPPAPFTTGKLRRRSRDGT